MAKEDPIVFFTSAIQKLTEAFSETDAAGKKSLDQLLLADAKTFHRAGIRVLAHAQDCPGIRYLVHLLSNAKMFTEGLLDPAVCSLSEAGAAACLAVKTGLPLQTALELAMNKELHAVGHGDSARILRSLDIIGAFATPASWNTLQTELMACPDSIVRSKAVLLIARCTKNAAWLGRRLMDRDVRVQANAVEALWEFEAEVALPLFKSALQSRNNRVMGNAALGMYRLGQVEVIPFLFRMARHSDELFQLSGLWAIGQAGDIRFMPFLQSQMKVCQGRVRLALIRALAQIRQKQKANGAAGELQICATALPDQADGRRRATFVLSGAGDAAYSWKPLDFALWKGSSLLEDYAVKTPRNPSVPIAAADSLEQTSADLADNFEVSYSPSSNSPGSTVTLKVSCPAGVGETEIAFPDHAETLTADDKQSAA